ncbi:MAG: hypothetical protein WC272_09165 [Sulfurimonas sp.]|jgi:hypothetical protein
MNDFRMKVILTILTGIIFSFLFIFLAFILPTQSDKQIVIKKQSNDPLLQEVSKSFAK